MYVCIHAGLCCTDSMVEIASFSSYGNDILQGERVLDLGSEDEIIYEEMKGRRGFLGELNKETKASEA